MAYYEYTPSPDGKGYYFCFDYHEDLVAAIKQVPYLSRRWDPDEKHWFVDRHWFKDACRFLDHAITKNTRKRGPHGREAPGRTEEGRTEHGRTEEGRQNERQWNEWKQDPFGGRGNSSHFRTATTDPLAAAFQTLHLQPDAPLPVVEAVYKALARIHHPDVGGTHERMRDINVAYDKVKAVAPKA